MMVSFHKKHLAWISLSGCFIILLPFACLFAFAHPAADDISYTCKFIASGSLFPAWAKEYFHWNGRYSSNLFVLENPLRWHSLILYRICLLALMLLNMSGLYVFLRALTQRKLTRHFTLLLACLLYCLSVSQMPALAEGLYWYTGVVTYQLGNAVILFYLAFLIKGCVQQAGARRNAYLFAAALLLLFAVGFNETIMLMLLLFHVLIFIVALSSRSSSRNLFLFFLLLSIVSAAIVISAPGNNVRYERFPVNRQFWYSFFMSVLQVFRFSLYWTASLPLLLCSLLYWPLCRCFSSRIQLFKKHFYIHPFVALFLLLSIPFLAVFPAYWGTGILGQHRTVNVACFFFQIFWFVNLDVWIGHYQLRAAKFLSSGKSSVKSCLLLALFICLLFTRNSFHAWDDLLSGRARQYDRELCMRYEVFENAARSGSTATVAVLTSRPVSLFVLDMSEKQPWIAKYYASYYHLKEIRLKE